MFRKMRRFKQEISKEECIEILKTEKRGVLSVIGDNDYPYAVPINFYYNDEDGKIYLHGAKEGHKIDSIKSCNKVCFKFVLQFGTMDFKKKMIGLIM